MSLSAREYDLRYRRAHELMKSSGLSALLLTEEENFTYFTAVKSLIPWASFTRPSFVIIPADHDPVAIVHTAMENQARRKRVIKDVRVYETSEDVPFGGSPVDMLVMIFRELELDRTVIGAELGLEQRLGLPYIDFERLKSALPDADFVDASAVLWELRMVKSKEEIRCIRKACNITTVARRKCFDVAKVGMSERQLANLFYRYLIEAGADRPCFAHIVSGTLAQSTLMPTNKRLRKGETLLIDGGCYVGDYSCDFDRIARIGRPSKKQLELHKLIGSIARKMAVEYKPGAKVADIARICWKEYERSGMPVTGAGRAGHGQGMLPTEPPSISQLDSTVLRPGMVVSVEPGLVTDWGVFVWEDVLAITEDGHELLSNESSELRRI